MSHHEFFLDELLEQFSLPHTRKTWREMAERADRQHWSHEMFLGKLLTQEQLHRRVSQLHQRARRAGFPFLKTQNELDFSRLPGRCRQVLDACLERSFVSDGRSLLIVGAPGSGKTHLAVAIAYGALQNGFDALHVGASELLEELNLAMTQGQWREALDRYARPDVLIIDQVDASLAHANLLFLLLNERHLTRRATVLTSTQPPGDWGARQADRMLASLIVDRLLARGQVLYLDERSEPGAMNVSLPPTELSSEDLVSQPPPPAVHLAHERVVLNAADARRHHRYHVEFQVSLTSDHNFFSGFGRNLSEGGIFIATHGVHPVGDLIELDFILPSGHRVRTSGVVRWKRSAAEDKDSMPGIGVEFLALSPDDRRAIETFFQHREPIFHA